MTDQIPVEHEKSVTLSQETIEQLAKEISTLNKKMILEIFDDSRLVKWIHTQQVAANTTGFFKEIHQLSQVVFVQLGQFDAYIGNTAIDMG